MFPLDIANLIAFIGEFVFPYPATKPLSDISLSWISLISEMKCLTKTELLGLKSVKLPDNAWSLSFPNPSSKIWSDVDCAKSFPVL